MKKRNILTYFKVMAFTFVCLFAVGITKVDASTVTVTTYDELKEAVNGHNDNITDTSITEVKLGADIAIPASAGMAILVVNDFTFDLNGYTLDITNDNSSMVIYYGSNNIENFTSGSLTITDTSESQTGTIKLGIKPIGVIQQNVSNTGMHYKLTIDGGKFYGKSGAYNRFFEFNTDNSYYWKDKLITFDFKITKGYFEHVSTNMSSIILANDMKLNNITFNMSFDNLTFKSGGNRLIASNESYSIDDVVPEDTNFYIFNSSEDKQVLIAERSTSVQAEVPSSLWYEVDGYTDTSYAGIKLVKKDGFDVTAPTFDSVNYDYTSVSAKEISIYNRGTSDLQVKSVTVDEPSKFTVIGTTQPTIASKATDNTSFTIKPVDGLEAGTYTATITVTDMSDKIYTATVTFNVGAKNLPYIGIDIEGTISYGEEYTPTIIEAPELGVGDYEFKYAKKVGESYQDIDDKPTSIGSYKVTINITNKNYSASDVSVFYDIVAKTITPTIENIADQTYTGLEIKPTVVVKDGEVTLTEGTDYKVSYSNNINVGTATATISKVADSNYTFSDKEVNFTIKKAQLEKVTLRTNEIIYNGLGSFPAMDNYNKSLQELSGTTGATNVGDYTTTVALKDSANYEWVDGTTGNLTLNWKIIQATPTYELPTNLTGVKGNTLADVTLSGRFTWNIPSTELVVGTHTYKATYTPEDTLNYKTITDIDITVVTKDLFDVNTSVNGGNGTITSSKTNVIEGSVVELTFTPNTGYMIDKVLVNGTSVTIEGNTLELTVNEDKEVVVSYKKIPFTVTVKDVTGATITPNGAVSVNYGDDKEFTISVNSGYRLIKVLVDGTDKMSTMVGDKLTLTNITFNMKLEVVVEKIIYEVTEGANQEYTITKNDEAKFKIDADYRLFDNKVYIDNVLVDSQNYTSESGSTIITFKQSYIDTLSVGEHTLKVVFIDGGEANTKFMVTSVTPEVDNPKTGENMPIYIITSILSLLILIGTIVVVKRKHNN